MFSIEKTIIDDLVSHALEEYPNECCGVLAGREDTVSMVYRISNVAESPYRYLMDPQEFLDADIDAERSDSSFLAFYHSHTHSQAYPSDTDVRMAQQSGYHDVYYLLVSLAEQTSPSIRAFHISDAGEVTEVRFNIT